MCRTQNRAVPGSCMTCAPQPADRLQGLLQAATHWQGELKSLCLCQLTCCVAQVAGLYGDSRDMDKKNNRQQQQQQLISNVHVCRCSSKPKTASAAQPQPSTTPCCLTLQPCTNKHMVESSQAVGPVTAATAAAAAVHCTFTWKVPSRKNTRILGKAKHWSYTTYRQTTPTVNMRQVCVGVLVTHPMTTPCCRATSRQAAAKAEHEKRCPDRKMCQSAVGGPHMPRRRRLTLV